MLVSIIIVNSVSLIKPSLTQGILKHFARFQLQLYIRVNYLVYTAFIIMYSCTQENHKFDIHVYTCSLHACKIILIQSY